MQNCDAPIYLLWVSIESREKIPDIIQTYIIVERTWHAAASIPQTCTCPRYLYLPALPSMHLSQVSRLYLPVLPPGPASEKPILFYRT